MKLVNENIKKMIYMNDHFYTFFSIPIFIQKKSALNLFRRNSKKKEE